jgi:uncharacterized delta-60 repeat protein
MRAARSGRSWTAVAPILVALLVLFIPASSSAVVPCGPDTTFGTNGVVVSDLGSTDEFANAIAVRPSGSIVVAGSSARAMTAAQYLPDGTLDPSFGLGGIARIFRGDFPTSSGTDLALQADGKAVLVGSELGVVSDSSRLDILVARLNLDGTRDTSFGGGDGAVYLDFQSQQDAAAAVAIDSAGRIVVAGTSSLFNSDSNAVVVRLLPDGSLDPSFGTQGTVVIDLGTDFDRASGLALQADGALLVVGSYQPSFLVPWLARLLPDGSRDRRFGRKGMVIPRNGGRWYDVAIQPDGRIVTAGEMLGEIAVARYLLNGKADSGFGVNGIATAQVDPTGFLSSRANGMAIHADGRIFVVGDASSTNVSDMAAAAFLPDGSLDARFGSGGTVRQDNPDGWDSALQDVTLLPDGSALGSGHVGFNIALARYTACG